MFELPKLVSSKILFNEPLWNHTSLKIGGPADVVIIPRSIKDILEIILFAEKANISLYVLGNGTKLLVSDSGVRGIVLKLAGNFSNIAKEGETIVAQSGALLPKLVEISVNQNMSGLEFAAGIPGTLGGAITMNAGTYLGSMSNVVYDVTVAELSGELKVLHKKDCWFDYRESIFQQAQMIILGATIKLKHGDPEKLEQKISELMARRRRSQPLDRPNAGCTFKNPEGFSAGRLIDEVGLKGLRVGNAQISTLHANFIVNLGNATAHDVLALIKLAQERVKDRYGIQLVPEIRIIGEWPDEK